MNDEIKAPIILFLDDGARVFRSVQEAEQWLEPVDVRNHPEWHGYDSNCRRITPEISSRDTRVLGAKTTKEVIVIRSIKPGNLESEDWAKEMMAEYLKRLDANVDIGILLQLPAEDLLKRVLERLQTEEA